MSPTSISLAIVVIFLLFAILVGYAVIKLTYRNHHYPPTYYPPMGPQHPRRDDEGGGGGGTLLAMIGLIVAAIILVLLAVNSGSGASTTQQGGLEYVRSAPPTSFFAEVDPSDEPMIPPAYDRTPSKRTDLAGVGQVQTPSRNVPAPVTYERQPIPEEPTQEIYPTYGYQFAAASNEEWAKSAAAKLRKTYPKARVVYIKGSDIPYKLILFDSTLREHVVSWRESHPDVQKGYIIDLPVPE